MDKVKRFLKYDAFILLLDIIAVNAAYFLSLVLRFSIANRLDPLIGNYIYTVIHFAPIYTVICIVVFFLFKLYGGMWRYAGIGDVNRIFFANLITTAVHILVTILFYQRMPISYYVMGAFAQMFLVAFIRFVYRFAVLEKRTIGKSKASNALVVGTKETGSQMIKLLTIGVEFRPVAVLDCKDKDSDKMMDSIPVYGKEDLEFVVKKHQIKAIFIADSKIESSLRDYIFDFCKYKQIQCKDYTSFLTYKGDEDSLADVIAAAPGAKTIDGKKVIPFSPPDISEAEIKEVVETLRSGWITTGPRVKLLERRLAAYIETGKTDVDTEREPAKYSNRLVCLSSATAAEELNLRVLGIGPGDEVIIPAYTYTASASAIIHCGATVKFVDIQKDGDKTTHAPEMDYDALENAITEKTKAILVVDLAGIVCDFDRVFAIAEKKKDIFTPKESDGTMLGNLSSRIQKAIGKEYYGFFKQKIFIQA